MNTVNDIKKAELVDLQSRVLNAQHDVELYKRLVNSITEKSQKYSGFLESAKANISKTLANKNDLADVIQKALLLKQNSIAANDQLTEAKENIGSLCTNFNILFNELIYVVNIVNKLSTLINRKKASDPLISDELINMTTITTKDANNAVALSLVALKSTFATNTSSTISKASASLENSQAIMLYNALTETSKGSRKSIQYVIDEAYDMAQIKYKTSQQARDMVITQLNEAQTKLNKAEVKLSSLEAGLEAANAAFLAS